MDIERTKEFLKILKRTDSSSYEAVKNGNLTVDEVINRKTTEYKWTTKQLKKVNLILDIITDLTDYLPLTLRQIYYQLVSKECILNNNSQYTMLSRLISEARLSGFIEWGVLEDRTRTLHHKEGFRDLNEFIKQHTDYFLEGYKRNLLQDQEYYIEIWVEKDALSSLFTKTVSKFSIPIVVCKGFSSVSFLKNYKNRLKENIEKTPVILYYGDLDPSGLCISKTIEKYLINRLNIKELQFKRIGLTIDDVKKYKLPFDPTAIKKTDTRTEKYLKEYGNYAVELDALEPSILVSKITNSILDIIDINKLNTQIEVQEKEIDKSKKIKQEILLKIHSSY